MNVNVSNAPQSCAQPGASACAKIPKASGLRSTELCQPCYPSSQSSHPELSATKRQKVCLSRPRHKSFGWCQLGLLVWKWWSPEIPWFTCTLNFLCQNGRYTLFSICSNTSKWELSAQLDASLPGHRRKLIFCKDQRAKLWKRPQCRVDGCARLNLWKNQWSQFSEVRTADCAQSLQHHEARVCFASDAPTKVTIRQLASVTRGSGWIRQLFGVNPMATSHLLAVSTSTSASQSFRAANGAGLSLHDPHRMEDGAHKRPRHHEARVLEQGKATKRHFVRPHGGSKGVPNRQTEQPRATNTAATSKERWKRNCNLKPKVWLSYDNSPTLDKIVLGLPWIYLTIIAMSSWWGH